MGVLDAAFGAMFGAWGVGELGSLTESWGEAV